MNILFLTLLDFDNIEERNIYTDLLRKFYKEGHGVYVVSPVERKKHSNTRCIKLDKRLWIAKPKIGNMQKTNIIEKGISTITIESKFIEVIKKYYANIKFDLVLYSTPPITLQKAVKYIKKRDGAVTYLMLKDIFPQNAVDMGMLSKKGVKGVLYRYFRNKERKLYRDSDYIGCMSEANVKYIKKHNPWIPDERLEICPNCIEPTNKKETSMQSIQIKEKYGIPTDRVLFIYGGNLGKPQGIPFMLKCLKAVADNKEAYFLIVGSGTEYHVIQKYLENSKLKNVKLIQYLPKEEYDELLGACDVGLIFLDSRFTIPNYPSRLLAYMDMGIPIIAATDRVTDIRTFIKEKKFGYWCESTKTTKFVECVEKMCDETRRLEMGTRARKSLLEEYTVEAAYEQIVKHF